MVSLLLLLALRLAAPAQSRWIAAWAASPQPAPADARGPLLRIEDQTVRERVRVSIGGERICIRLSNEYGVSPLVIGAVTVAIPNDWASIKLESVQTVTFNGRNSVTIPTGAPILSDPVAIPVDADSEISISLYFPNPVVTPTWHELSLKRAVVSRHGDHTRAERIEEDAAATSLIAVTAVLVPARPHQRVVVAFGDSITDGDGSSPDADQSWPSDLARRLLKSQIAVVNEGIVGNRLLSDCLDAFTGCFSVSALARFDRDALAVPGVTHIVLLEGINDIGFPGAHIERHEFDSPSSVRSADELIDAYRQLIARAHAHGIKVIGATLTPFEGIAVPGYYSESKEATRQAVNRWTRTSGAFDGLIDFDAVVRDPQHPGRLVQRFASKDGIHPNDDGHRAMADSIDLAVFR